MRVFLAILFLVFAGATPSSACTLQFEMTGAIGAGSLELLNQAMEKAEKNACTSLLMKINTPGGNLESTRLIVEKIVNSPRPFLCVVYPAGGHAGSAGAIILQACHVAGAVETTNIGAATPIVGTGESLKGDLRNKMVNDTVSWLEGLVELRGRNKKFAREIVETGKAVEAGEAKRIGAIDVLATSLEDFLQKADEREVKMTEGKTSNVSVGPLLALEKDFRTKFLDFIANPQIAYLLFMGSLALLYFEITHPGTMVPGVIGGVGLILALMAFHILDVNWGGLALILLGLGLLIAEVFVPSFGILGIGGIVAFVFGGILLFRGEASGLALSLKLILPTAIGAGGVMLLVGYFAAKAIRRRKKSGGDALVGETGVVSTLQGNQSGQVDVSGEIWNFIASAPVAVGDLVVIEKIDGLRALVKKKE